MNRTRTSTLDVFGLRNQRNRIYPALSASDGSTLDLDFTTMGSNLDSRFTFSRAGNATYINSSGYVALADANMLLQSESLATSPWSAQNGATATNVSITNPIGGATSTQITTGGTGSNSVGQTPTYGAAGAHTLSIWVRSGTATRISIGIYSGGFVTGTISVLSGSATVTGTDLFTVTNLTSTWTRLQIVYTTLSAGTVLIYPDTPSPTVPLTVYAWGAQLNQGSTAQTYHQTTTAAYYAPRFDYDPTTLAAKGLLIEGSATNAILYSESFVTSAGIYNDNAILSRTTTETSPSGGTAVCFFPTIALDYHRLQSASNPVLSGAVTISIWLKRKDSNYRGGINAGNYLGVSAVFDLNGAGSVVTLGGTATNKAATITAYANNWYRVSVTGTYIAANSHFIFMTSSTSTDSTGQNFLGVASQGLIMWGAQVELGKGASSYIPTVASQVTRAQELCTLPITPASIGLTTSPIGTCFYEATVNYLPTSGFPLIVGFTDIGNNSKAWLSQTSTTGSNYSVWRTTTGTVGDVTFSDVVIPKTSFKFASSISSTQNLASRNGTAGTAGAVSSAVLSVPTQLNFGGVIDSAIITKFKFFPTTKSQAELNALTT